jgi:hypothetical protein
MCSAISGTNMTNVRTSEVGENLDLESLDLLIMGPKKYFALAIVITNEPFVHAHTNKLVMKYLCTSAAVSAVMVLRMLKVGCGAKC